MGALNEVPYGVRPRPTEGGFREEVNLSRTRAAGEAMRAEEAAKARPAPTAPLMTDSDLELLGKQLDDARKALADAPRGSFKDPSTGAKRYSLEQTVKDLQNRYETEMSRRVPAYHGGDKSLPLVPASINAPAVPDGTSAPGATVEGTPALPASATNSVKRTATAPRAATTPSSPTSLAVPTDPTGAVAAPTPAPPQFTPIKTTAPETDLDGQIRIAHDIAQMAGMAGIPHAALQHSQIWQQLHSQRTGLIADEAIRSLAMGDPTKAIAMYNHVVPNGNEIVGYAPNADNTGYIFQYRGGKTQQVSNSDIANKLVQYKDPGYLGKLAFERAKSNAKTQEEMLKQMMIGQRASALEMQKARYAEALERLKADLKGDEILGISRSTVPGDDTIMARTKNAIYKLVKKPGIPVNGQPGKPTETWEKMSSPDFDALRKSGKASAMSDTTFVPEAISAGGWNGQWGGI